MVLDIIISKLSEKLVPVLRHMVGSHSKPIAVAGVLLGLYLLLSSKSEPGSSKGKGNVDMHFLRRIWRLTRVVVPSVMSKEALNVVILTILLVYRTNLSISISEVNGQIVKAIVGRDLNKFIYRIVNLAMYAIPASLVNSALDFLNKKLAIQFRKNLTSYLNDKYLQGMVYYKMTNLDSRIPHPDQRFTQDIDKWATCFSMIYSNLAKPVLDIVLFSKKLAELVGAEGPGAIIGWYVFSGLIIKAITPSFGKLIAEEQKNEGLYRAAHADIVNHAEEIAFYRGQKWERRRVDGTLYRLLQHVNTILGKKFWMGTCDSVLVKYGAVCVAYSVMGLPVFGRNKDAYLAKVSNDPSAITRDYIRNSSLFTNLAKAIGRLIISYKDIQHLAGYTSLISEANDVLDDILAGTYQRQMVEGSKYDHSCRGRMIPHDFVKFEDVPIVSPNGDLLVRSLNFEIRRGMHVFISGPNGCGKSSLFRILGELWPLFGGIVFKPNIEKMFYIPQRPYLPQGSFRDQIIYPHTHEQMLAAGNSDEELKKMLQIVKLDDILDKRGGLDKVEEWKDTLSGGQKQKLAMCRLLYHRPTYAILDECTSAISQDIEGDIYQHYKNCGITLITVSHRDTLIKYHDYVLKMDGEGGFETYRVDESMKTIKDL